MLAWVVGRDALHVPAQEDQMPRRSVSRVDAPFCYHVTHGCQERRFLLRLPAPWRTVELVPAGPTVGTVQTPRLDGGITAQRPPVLPTR